MNRAAANDILAGHAALPKSRLNVVMSFVHVRVISWIVSVRSGKLGTIHEITRSNTNGTLLTRELDLTFEANPGRALNS
jgi:hypothetical protein